MGTSSDEFFKFLFKIKAMRKSAVYKSVELVNLEHKTDIMRNYKHKYLNIVGESSTMDPNLYPYRKI